MQFLRLVTERILLSLLTLLLVSLIIFLMLEILPGDVASRILGRDATPETLAALRLRLHLDEPAFVRYGEWLGHLVTGRLGNSLVSDRPIADVLGQRMLRESVRVRAVRRSRRMCESRLRDCDDCLSSALTRRLER